MKRGSPLASYCSDDYGSTKMIFFGNDFRNVAEFIYKELKILSSISFLYYDKRFSCAWGAFQEKFSRIYIVLI